MLSLVNLYILSTRKKLRLDVDESKVVLGRTSSLEADGTRNIDLSDSMAYRLGVSRRHLMLVPEKDDIMAFDLSSRNGSKINGECMEPKSGYRLKDGDELSLGDLVVRVYFREEIPYEKFQTTELPSLEEVTQSAKRDRDMNEGITAPLPDIRNTMQIIKDNKEKVEF